MYVGALENYPALIDRMANIAPLWGNRGDGLTAVRSPFVLREWMTAEGLHTPVTLATTPTDTTTTWLVKPLASGGGRGITPWRGEIVNPETHVCQSLCPGTPVSAVFLGEGGSAEFLGATEQWLGTADSDFEYVGNIGPISLSDAQGDQVLRIGGTLARRARLLGLFGVDLTIDGDRVFLIEVNPRYTASVELLEWSQGRSLLGLHRAQSLNEPIPDVPRWPPLRGIVGKAILRAPGNCAFGSRISARRISRAGREFPTLADIPDSGTPIERGEPVLTVFARGTTVEQCRLRLQKRLEAWAARLRGS